MDVWIGTSGYSYADWVGPFYPAETRPGQMLAHYSRCFPLVELNFSFYHPPSKAMLTRMADQTPAGFQFLVKLPRSISHEESPSDLPGFREAVLELRRRGRLAGLLCQLPQATHRTRRSQSWLEAVGKELGDLNLAVEFRHRSWATPDLSGWMAERRLDLVAVDAPSLPGLFPSGWVQSGARVYVRLHSRNAASWYRSDKERYDYSYSDQELGEWVEGLTAAELTTQALFLFNNCHRGQAAENARRLRVLVEERAPGLNVVAPFGDTPLAQRSLFE
jgi:uncharacterized protein YecE (DUF72 family)